jgi:hypothetical protein
VKETKLKTEAMELLGKLAPTIKPRSNRGSTKNKRLLILRVKQLRYGSWEVSQPHIRGKNTAGCLKKSWERWNECQETQTALAAMEEFVFGTKEKEAAPPPTLLRCIASTTSIPGSGNTANTHNTVRFFANRKTTAAVRIDTRISTYSIKDA